MTPSTRRDFIKGAAAVVAIPAALASLPAHATTGSGISVEKILAAKKILDEAPAHPVEMLIAQIESALPGFRATATYAPHEKAYEIRASNGKFACADLVDIDFVDRPRSRDMLVKTMAIA